jgi:hypothetical protein
LLSYECSYSVAKAGKARRKSGLYIYIYIVTNSLSGGYENKNDEMNELI